ncbi:hypothetical protein [[Erwinia] mediterraneensis]|uniref:hypothetical protein n=1 Tax=[Erwinia] mediterraneensis TaxID=2161819 RepID=UPI0010317367|nr:hypothetical protein [[Erwinia] mediterraneensis]
MSSISSPNPLSHSHAASMLSLAPEEEHQPAANTATEMVPVTVIPHDRVSVSREEVLRNRGDTMRSEGNEQIQEGVRLDSEGRRLIETGEALLASVQRHRNELKEQLEVLTSDRKGKISEHKIEEVTEQITNAEVLLQQREAKGKASIKKGQNLKLQAEQLINSGQQKVTEGNVLSGRASNQARVETKLAEYFGSPDVEAHPQMNKLIQDRAEALTIMGETADSIAEVMSKGAWLDDISVFAKGSLGAIPFAASGFVNTALAARFGLEEHAGDTGGVTAWVLKAWGDKLLESTGKDVTWLAGDKENLMSEVKDYLESKNSHETLKKFAYGPSGFDARNLINIGASFIPNETAKKAIDAGLTVLAGGVGDYLVNKNSVFSGPQYLLGLKDGEWQKQYQALKDTKITQQVFTNGANRAIELGKSINPYNMLRGVGNNFKLENLAQTAGLGGGLALNSNLSRIFGYGVDTDLQKELVAKTTNLLFGGVSYRLQMAGGMLGQLGDMKIVDKYNQFTGRTPREVQGSETTHTPEDTSSPRPVPVTPEAQSSASIRSNLIQNKLMSGAISYPGNA